MNAFELTSKLVRNCLQLKGAVPLTEQTPLLGGFAEFNSLTIATLIVEIEEAVGCDIEDEELSSEIFETIGSLAGFVEMKRLAI